MGIQIMTKKMTVELRSPEKKWTFNFDTLSELDEQAKLIMDSPNSIFDLDAYKRLWYLVGQANVDHVFGGMG